MLDGGGDFGGKAVGAGEQGTDGLPTAIPAPPAALGDELTANAAADLGKQLPVEPLEPPGLVGQLLFGGLIVAFVGAVTYRLTVQGTPDLAGTEIIAAISNWLIPVLICMLLLVGYFRGVKVYEAATEGAKEGFQIAVRIIPFLVAIFVAIAMVRASGALDLMTALVAPITGLFGFPAEALPMALIRPLSGGGAFGVMSEIVNNDPDSFVAYLVSTMQGSTETTFYNNGGLFWQYWHCEHPLYAACCSGG